MDRVNEALGKYEKQLQLDQYPLLNQAHEKTGKQRIHLVLGVAVVVGLILIRLLGLSFISNLYEQHTTHASAI